ncbi:early nodulin-like protein 1 [Andrographis paniculata]|uniref:early nodulin-like protein 1 n=1 Tax=Andrographis paniculata TaxID=175694 RepID=UPI0021E8E1B7|nr:early nodulin-like protein 1 [Andrographis paniculata]
MAFLKSFLTYLAIALFLIFATTGVHGEHEFPVGGRHGFWKVPSSPDVYENWAERLRFLIGDTLVLRYDPKADSVLQVTEQSYKICNKSDPIKSYGEGNTRIVLERSGPFFFISGAQGHCEKGQKFAVWVLSPKRGTHIHSPAPSPSDHHHLHHSPAPAPSSSGSRLIGGVIGGGVAAVAAAVLFI